MSVRNYNCMLHNNSEECRSHNKICKPTSFNCATINPRL